MYSSNIVIVFVLLCFTARILLILPHGYTWSVCILLYDCVVFHQTQKTYLLDLVLVDGWVIPIACEPFQMLLLFKNRCLQNSASLDT